MISLPMLASNSGVEAEVASDATGNNMLTMPKIIKVKGNTTVTLPGAIDTSLKVTELLENGAMGAVMTPATNASTTEYAFTGGDGADADKFTSPSNPDKTYLVRYDRKVSNGAIVHNSADKFPDTICLILKCLAVDPCNADTLKAMYLELPSFQPSPEITVGLQTDTTLDYTGDLQVKYCDDDKPLYNIYWCDDDEE